MQGSVPRFDVRDYFRIAQKRKWFIILVGLAAMLVGGLYAVSYPKVYRATSTVLVRMRPAGVVWLASPAGRQGNGEIALETQASMIVSGELARKVALALREKQSAQRVLSEMPEVRQALAATPRPPDRIQIDARSPIERNAVAFANEAAVQFVVMNTEFRREQDTRARKYLEEQLARAEEQLNDVHADLTTFRHQMGVYSEDAGASAIMGALARYSTSRADAMTELAAAEGQLEAVNALIARSESGASKPQRIANPTVAVLRNQLTAAEVALAELRGRYQDAHPAVQELLGRVDSLKAEIATAPGTTQVPAGALGAQADVLARQRDALIARKADLEARIEILDTIMTDLEGKAQTIPEKQSALFRLTSRAELLNETHARVLEQLEAKRLEEEAKGGTAMIFDTATQATSASPSVSRLLLFSGFLGLFVGVAMALVLEALDDTIHTPEDITKETDVTFLGMVPLLDTVDDELITISAPRSPPAEAYRTLRSNINFSMVDEPARMFLVTSAGTGEGKTATAANLAVVLAHAGQNVIVVDTDLRRPALHRVLHRASTPGLTNVLMGETTIEEALQETSAEGLRIMASGPLPPNPAELLDSATMEQFIQQIGDYADVVLFDSPPAIVLTDAVVLSAKVERTILVAEAGQVTREAFREATRLIEKARGTILGVVLNKLRLSAHDYYYYYYYDYTGEGGPPDAPEDENTQ